ncbi:MAG: MarR family transcriptional regulator [Thermomicrobiales bacterium]
MSIVHLVNDTLSPPETVPGATAATTLEIAREALDISARLHRWAATAVQTNRSEQDPSLRQLGVLFAVRDGVSSPVAIARRLRVNRAVVTGLLDRLEQRELVRREPDPEDRRRQRVVMTPAGQAACQSIGTGLAGELAACLPLASPQDLAGAARTLAQLAQAVAALEAQTPPPGGFAPGGATPDLASDLDADPP